MKKFCTNQNFVKNCINQKFLYYSSSNKISKSKSSILRQIFARRNDQRFLSEVAMKSFRQETIFNFHMNGLGTIVENKADFFIIKSKVITF